MDKDNPHDIIKLIGKPKEWREKASIILIRLWEDNERIKWMQRGELTLLLFVVSLLLKLIFFS